MGTDWHILRREQALRIVQVSWDATRAQEGTEVGVSGLRFLQSFVPFF